MGGDRPIMTVLIPTKSVTFLFSHGVGHGESARHGSEKGRTEEATHAGEDPASKIARPSVNRSFPGDDARSNSSNRARFTYSAARSRHMSRPLAALAFIYLTATHCRSADLPKVDFAHDVVPILRTKCGECHTGNARKGDLSLNTLETLMASKGVVVPGKSKESELVKRITSRDKELRMPSKGPALSEKEIATITAWVDGGAKWEPGFSFAKRSYVAPLGPRTPALPEASAPDRANPIDRIIDTHLAVTKTRVPLVADDVVFIRRLYLDVIGLLPTPGQVDEFVADRSPDKKAALVRRLLADDRRYAEHWLTFWNDLLRNDYSGTGYIDGGRK